MPDFILIAKELGVETAMLAVLICGIVYLYLEAKRDRKKHENIQKENLKEFKDSIHGVVREHSTAIITASEKTSIAIKSATDSNERVQMALLNTFTESKKNEKIDRKADE